MRARRASDASSRPRRSAHIPLSPPSAPPAICAARDAGCRGEHISSGGHHEPAARGRSSLGDAPHEPRPRWGHREAPRTSQAQREREELSPPTVTRGEPLPCRQRVRCSGHAAFPKLHRRGGIRDGASFERHRDPASTAERVSSRGRRRPPHHASQPLRHLIRISSSRRTMVSSSTAGGSGDILRQV